MKAGLARSSKYVPTIDVQRDMIDSGPGGFNSHAAK